VVKLGANRVVSFDPEGRDADSVGNLEVVAKDGVELYLTTDDGSDTFPDADLRQHLLAVRESSGNFGLDRVHPSGGDHDASAKCRRFRAS